ncbi:peptide-methionine (R)-S-oxide reductase MsrB [Rhodoflexus caldus]|uniref:peptide-methionine (R)-S-oxide reductase MsrB n=1 Tax=Rhodoflexus caldus TaxID=2891236 RepID=UPI00202AA00B|nr:peptide-methionine (R)-S-oxide reductase MsrB [Rhodoflexus caldus]
MKYWIIASLALLFANCTNGQNMDMTSKKLKADEKALANVEKVVKTEEEWRKSLTPEQYYILREKGTERPFSGKFYLHKEKGIYTCAACGYELFSSDQKFDSGCGWPSFFDEIGKGRIKYRTDTSHGMVRTEIMCARCDGHLGHVFDDGPNPTGLRYCVNSVSIDFKKADNTKSKQEE